MTFVSRTFVSRTFVILPNCIFNAFKRINKNSLVILRYIDYEAAGVQNLPKILIAFGIELMDLSVSAGNYYRAVRTFLAMWHDVITQSIFFKWGFSNQINLRPA